MKSLREHLRELEILENEAAETAGMRFLLLDEKRLLGKDSKKYIAEYVAQLEADITPQALEAAKLGQILFKEVMNK